MFKLRMKTLLWLITLPLAVQVGGCEMDGSGAENSNTASDAGFDSMPVGVKVEKASQLKVKPQVGGVLLSWDAVPDAQNYAIYWQPSASSNAGNAGGNARGRGARELPEATSNQAIPQSVGFGTMRFETADNTTSYFHRGLASGHTHYYRVAAIFANGDEGDACEPVAVIPAPALAMQSQPSDGAP